MPRLSIALIPALFAACASAPDPAKSEEAVERYKAAKGYSATPATFEQAVELYTQAVSLDPVFPQAYYERAIVLERMGRIAEAEADLGRAIQSAPEDQQPLYHYLRGRYLHKHKRYDDAVTDYTRAIEKGRGHFDNRLPYYYMHRAFAYEDGGKPDKAVGDYEVVLRLRPDDVTRRQIEDRLQVLKSR